MPLRSRSRFVSFQFRRPTLETLEDRLAPAVLFSENFDGVVLPNLPPGWFSSATGAAQAWRHSNTGLAAGAGHTPPHAAVAANAANVGDTRLDSPTFTVTGLNAQVTFNLNFDTEPGFDGGQLHISINGGAFQE